MKFFSLFSPREIRRSQSRKIIPREEFSQLLEAKDLIQATKQDIKDYRAQVEEECETLKEKAKEEGFQKGLTEFNKQILYLEQQLKEIRHEVQKSMLPLSLKAAKKIVGEELQINPDTIVTIVMNTLRPVTENRHIRIFVSKEDREILDCHKPELKKMFDHLESLLIIEREDIEPGGCIIETEAGIINASLENQWRALESAFESYMKR